MIFSTVNPPVIGRGIKNFPKRFYQFIFEFQQIKRLEMGLSA
jgi:hypothetical protein